MRELVLASWVALSAVSVGAGDAATAWQKETLGPRMLHRGGRNLPAWEKSKAASYDQIAGGLGFQVYFDAGKLHLHQFSLVGYGSIPIAQERFWSQRHGLLFHHKLIPLGAFSGAESGELTKGPCDWARGEYAVREGSFSICVSRLCPGLLLRSKRTEFHLFEGITPPKFFAYSKGETVQACKVEGASPVRLDGISEPWLLCWFGDASAFKSCRLPQPPFLAEEMPLQDEWCNADFPILLVLQSVPISVTRQEKALALKLAKADAGDEWAAKLIVLPLLGQFFPGQSETAAWASALPKEVAQRCAGWSRHLDQYPIGVAESYSCDGDDAAVKEAFHYEAFRRGGAGRYAPVPPMLAIAQQGRFPIEFSAQPADTGVRTAWGPCLAVENAPEYSIRFRGLMKYVDERLVPNPERREPEALARQLEAMVADVVKAGHLAPYVPMFTDGGGGEYMANPEWSCPGDGLIHMARYLALLPEGLRRDALAWMKAEREGFPPEQVTQLEYTKGARRELYPIDNPAYIAQQKQFEARGYRGHGDNLHLRLKILPLENVTALTAWYETAGKDERLSWDAVQKILEPYLRRLDWASLGYVSWEVDVADAYYYGQGGVMDINRLWCALRGAARLAKLAGNPEAETMCRALFCKAAALRFAIGRYADYLYASGIKELPKDPAFLLKLGRGLPPARALNLYTDSWKSREDDIQQVIAMDEFGTLLHETAGTFDRNQLASFRPMSPELGRFLGDFLRSECAAYVRRVEHFAPDWYIRYSLTCLGSEAYALPFDTSWQVFLAKAWILGEDPARLEKYLDMPWTKLGDFYHMDKLAAAVVAYRGPRWEGKRP